MRVPRPVAGLPDVDPERLAKAWLLALVDARPLSTAATVPVARLAGEGPVVADALLAALADDAALAALPDHGASMAALTGAADARETLVAVELLRAAAMAALRQERVAPDVLADAADRLAHAVHALGAAAVAASAAAAPPPEIRARDQRETPASLVARALERHAADGEPFAVLLGEVADLERWRVADPAAVDAAAAAVAAALRPGDRLVCEDAGRWWIVAPETEPDAAHALARMLAEAGEGAGPAGVAFGVAGCPRDGVDGEALAAQADEALLRARASGVPVA